MRNGQSAIGISPYWHASAALLVLLLASAFTTSWLVHVDIVARASGRIVPSSAIRPVDSQIAGKVVTVFVSPGDYLESGAPILKVDDTDFTSEIESFSNKTIKAKQDDKRARAALEALERFDPADPVFVQKAMDKYAILSGVPNDARSSQASLRAELSSLSATIAENDATSERMKADLAASDARVQKSEAILAIENASINASDGLFKSGTISRMDLLKRSQPFELAKAELEISKQEFVAREAEIAALKQKRVALVASSMEHFRTVTETAQAIIVETESQLVVSRHNKEATILRAPTSGRIEEFKSRTVGARLSQGQTIAKIVPVDDKIEIEANLPSNEASFVREGQQVRVKLDAYPSEQFGSLVATVQTISSDTVQGSDGKWNYILRILPEKAILITSSGSVHLTAGITVEADIITGSRRLISYLFEPVVRALTEGVNER